MKATSHLDDKTIGLLWRVAQESVRNATRHGSPTRIAVRVHTSARGAELEVLDDGVGFDVSQAPTPGHFGLRGLHDLADEAGGRLDVLSAPGSGTRVHLEVFAR